MVLLTTLTRKGRIETYVWLVARWVVQVNNTFSCVQYPLQAFFDPRGQPCQEAQVILGLRTSGQTRWLCELTA